VNFSDLSSIGAGADAADRATDVAMFGAPVDAAAESDADHEEGEFGALLDLLALATQAVPPPAMSAPAATPGTLESLAQRAAVDVTEIFKQRTAIAATVEPDPGTAASLALTSLEQEPSDMQPSLGGTDGAGAATAAGGVDAVPDIAHAPAVAGSGHAARHARELVERAIAAADKAAAVPTSDATVPGVAQPSASPEATESRAPSQGPKKDLTTAARPQTDVEMPSPPVAAAPATEDAGGDTTPPAVRALHVTTHTVHASADVPAAADAQPVVAAEVAAPSSADAANASTAGNASDGGQPSSDGEQMPSEKTGSNVNAPRADATVVEAFSPQLAARIYEAAAAAAASPTPEAGELADVVPQIVRSIHLQSVGEVGHARVQLRPEHLGEVIIELRVEQGDVIASLQADRPEVRAWIETQAGELREALGAQGLELMHFSVRDREESPREGRREHEPRKQKRQPRGDHAVRFELPAA
jgi:chemotaxis protein MotD